MGTSQLLGRHLKEFLHGNSMTGAHVKEHLDDVTLQEATTQIAELNTIAALTFHINYYIEAQLQVFNGGSLDAKDFLSFKIPPITIEKDWETLKNSFYSNIEKYAQCIEQLSEGQLNRVFVLEKYGSYHRNIMGLSEHSHYHLGQIALLKKLIRNKTAV